MFQVPALVCMPGICSQPPWSNGGKVTCRIFKSCLLSEQVKTSNVSGLCVHKRYAVRERRVSAVAKRIDLEKLESLRYECSDHAVTMKWWSSRSLGQQGGSTASSRPWTSGEQTLASSGICLVEYHGIQPWREEGPKKAG